jgi:predicted AAA+ superfamily ATPase
MPIVAVVGPRQAGKSTLCARVFADKPHVTLESLEARENAVKDPVGFLSRFPAGAVLDEVQRVPHLFSELQVDVDRHPTPGRWVLTGSQNFNLLASISQSLATRVALLTLLPLSFEELSTERGADPETASLFGGYPRIHDRHLDPLVWLDDYVMTYVERDARQVLNIGDLGAFQTFLGLCAGRAGQLLNLSSLGAEAGVTAKTAKAWLSVLEASFLVFQMRPYFRNVGKRLTKSTKLYFCDVGLLCRLLGIRTADQLRHHPLRGSIFEKLVVTEILKSRLHRGQRSDLYFYRDQSGREVDVLVDDPLDPVLIEVKSTRTVLDETVRPLRDVASVLEGSEQPPRSVRSILVHAGDQDLTDSGIERVPWHAAARILGAG